MTFGGMSHNPIECMDKLPNERIAPVLETVIYYLKGPYKKKRYKGKSFIVNLLTTMLFSTGLEQIS